MAHQADSSHSFIDLMISLAIIFILLLVATLNNAATGGQQTVDDLKQQMTPQLMEMGVKMVPDPNDPTIQIIRLDENKVKFDFRKSDLDESGMKLISDLFIKITPKLCNPKYRDKIESISINGYTDSVGSQTLRGKLKNVDLSQDRALAVMKEACLALDENGMKKEEDFLTELVSAAGRGSNDPLPNLPDSANRRVEIRIKFKTILPNMD